MLTFLHISDTHICADPPDSPSRLPNRGVEALSSRVRRLPFEIDFILHSGDVCADPLAENYLCARELLRQFELPMYLLPGNHDSAELLKELVDDGEQMRVLRDDHLQLGGYDLVTVDSNGIGDTHAPSLLAEQFATFARHMEQTDGRPTIVALHHPLIKTGVEWLDETLRIQNGGPIQDILKRQSHHIVGVFHGHIHQATSSYSDGVLYTCCPSSGSNLAAYPGLRQFEADLDTPGGFNLVVVRENRTFIRRYSLPAGP